jgi:hypothetical protein
VLPESFAVGCIDIDDDDGSGDEDEDENREDGIRIRCLLFSVFFNPEKNAPFILLQLLLL